MNSVLTQLPKAQDAYMDTLSHWTEVDTGPILIACDTAIRRAISEGRLATGVGNIDDIRMAEKAAVELQEIGYRAIVVSGGYAPQLDGSQKPLMALNINWKNMPESTRDAYTV